MLVGMRDWAEEDGRARCRDVCWGLSDIFGVCDIGRRRAGEVNEGICA